MMHLKISKINKFEQNSENKVTKNNTISCIGASQILHLLMNPINCSMN